MDYSDDTDLANFPAAGARPNWSFGLADDQSLPALATDELAASSDARLSQADLDRAGQLEALSVS